MTYTRQRYNGPVAPPDTAAKVHEEFRRVQRAIPHPAFTVDLRDFDVDFRGKNDSTTAVNIAFAQAAGGTVLGTPGTIAVTSTLNLPATTSLWLHRECAFQAQASMTALLQTPLNTLMEDQWIIGGQFLSNSLADVGVDVQWARHLLLRDVLVEDYQVAGIRLGNASAPNSSYSNVVTGCRTHRPTVAVPAGSMALHVRSATDSIVSDCEFVGGEIGVRAETSSNLFSQVHCWTRQTTGAMQKGFYDTGTATRYVNCYADTPTVYGWQLGGFNTTLSGCKVSNTVNGGLDNVMIGVRFDQTSPFSAVYGISLETAGPTYRILKDFEFAGTGESVTILGTMYSSDVTNLTDETIGLRPVRLNRGVTVGTDTTGKAVTLNGAAGDSGRRINITTAGSSRWAITSDATAEGGANAGSNLNLNAYDDAGAFLQLVATFARATGISSWASELHANGGLRIGSLGTVLTEARAATFTLSAAATTSVGSAAVTANSLIYLQATNAAAATLMQSTKALYISARTAGTSFTVATADGTAAAGTETFNYWMVN